jgi:hypothetical protein
MAQANTNTPCDTQRQCLPAIPPAIVKVITIYHEHLKFVFYLMPLQGDLVVNGVVASPYPVTHRILDATPASMLSSLPALYHAMTLPIWEQYQQIGSHAMAEKQAQYQPLVTAFLGAGSLTAGLASHDDSITT